MQKNKHIVHKIIDSDRECFGVLVGKLTIEDYKRIYNRCYTRLKKKGLTKDQIRNGIKEQIRGELFKLIPQVDLEAVTDRQRREYEVQREQDRKEVRMRGFRIWDNEETEGDKIQELEESYQKAIDSAFAETFCPFCHCEKAYCRCLS